LSREISESLLSNIQLKGPTDQKHEISTKSIGNVIFLATGWSDFISCYSLKRHDVLVFFYEGNSTFHVRIFYQNVSEITEPRGVIPSTGQVGSRGAKRGKQIPEAEASFVLGYKRG
jgi:hypothetical protein